MSEIKIYKELEQRSQEWYDIRRERVTSSKASVLMAARGLGKTAQTYAMELAADLIMEMHDDGGMVNFAMQHGIDTEPIAREAYEEKTFSQVEEIGFITKGTGQGTSPDGVFGADGMIEIKCPQPGNHIKYLMADDCPAEYYDQVQHQMYVAGRKWCDFVTFNDFFIEEYQMKITRVYPDLKWVEKYEQRFAEFMALVNEYKLKLKIK